jgi:hypothetical protein
MAIVGVVHQIWRTHQLFCFKILFMGCPCAFPPCHVATPDWATWRPLIGPCCPLPSQHTTSTRYVNMPHQSYRLPHGTIRLVHRSIQNAKNWVTCGSLWCCHIIMLMSTCHVSLPFSCHVFFTDTDVICTKVDVSSTDADSSPDDWARLTKL